MLQTAKVAVSYKASGDTPWSLEIISKGNFAHWFSAFNTKGGFVLSDSAR